MEIRSGRKEREAGKQAAYSQATHRNRLSHLLLCERPE
jgi:hypothetical protein